MLRDYIRTGTTDQKLMTSLLEKEVERMNLKQELEDKDALKLYMVCDFGNHNNIWLSFP